MNLDYIRKILPNIQKVISINFLTYSSPIKLKELLNKLNKLSVCLLKIPKNIDRDFIKFSTKSIEL